MHVYDIEEALAQADALSLRRAFQVLTHFPHEGHIEGARTAAKLAAVFDTVVLALELDQATMPEKLCRTIEHVTRVPIEANATYSHGTMVAAEYCESWRAMFLAHADAPHNGRSARS